MRVVVCRITEVYALLLVCCVVVVVLSACGVTGSVNANGTGYENGYNAALNCIGTYSAMNPLSTSQQAYGYCKAGH